MLLMQRLACCHFELLVLMPYVATNPGSETSGAFVVLVLLFFFWGGGGGRFSIVVEVFFAKETV